LLLGLLMGLGLKVHVGHVLGLEHDLGLGVDPSYKPCWDHIISSQGVEATDKGVYIPVGIALDLACKQFKQLGQWFCISLYIWGQKNFSLSMAKVLATPK